MPRLVSGSHGARSLLLTLASVAACWSAPAVVAQDRPSLREVLARAGAYVVAYGEALATVIGDEEYVQQLVAPDGRVLDERVLQAEIAFVPIGGGRDWLAVRSVLRVDGVEVAGAAERLERLFREAPASLVGQARQIAGESARFNLGPLARTFNAPTMPLQFLHPMHQDRFRFDRRGEESSPAGPVWVVRLRDRGGATLIRSSTGRPVPIEGLVQIAPEDGRVVRASFTARDFVPEVRGRNKPEAVLEVEWEPDAQLDLWVPAVMRERYRGPWDADGQPYDIVGVARYSNYRRFEVESRIIDPAR